VSVYPLLPTPLKEQVDSSLGQRQCRTEANREGVVGAQVRCQGPRSSSAGRGKKDGQSDRGRREN